MRIRRYAARLLSSSATTNNPASPTPQPAAAWLHDATGDCCAFCDLAHSPTQEAPDAVKHKGHIACRVPESEVKGGELVGLAQGLSAPEEPFSAKKCKVDHGHPENEADESLIVTNGGSVVTEAAAKLEEARGATLVTKAAVNIAFKAGPFVANDVTIDQEVKCGGSLVTDTIKADVTGGNSHVNGWTTELEVLKDAPVSIGVVPDPAVTEGVSLERGATTLRGATCIEPDVTGEYSIMNESGAELGVIRTASLVNEASTEPELTERVSVTTKGVTDAGVTITVPEVTRTGSLGYEGAVGLEIAREAAELEATEADPIASQADREADDTGRVSRSVEDDPALDESQPPSSDMIGNVQVGNAGETVATVVEPSQCDVADVDGSVGSTSYGHVGAKDSIVEGGAAHDKSGTPSVSCTLGVVARSIGRSERTDVICYTRRRGKRKLDLLEVKTENIDLDDGVSCNPYGENKTLKSNGPCESMISRAVSVDVKLADIKRELMENSPARKVKKMKTNKFECNIDYCRMTFKTKTELSVHKKNMCTVKSCSRHFRSHKYLRRHQSVHNDDMPYKCPWEGCSIAFKWPWDRAEHFQVHAGVKPYKCMTPGCSKIYKFVSDFTRHRRRCKPQE